MIQYLFAKANAEKKQISKEYARELVARSGKDFALFVSEVDKLFTYTGQNEVITFDNIQAVCSSKEYSFWQKAEAIIWEKKAVSHILPSENDSLLFLSILRKELRVGLKLKNSKPTEKITGIFPWLVEKRKKQASNFSIRYFQQGLLYLYEMEMRLKNGLHHHETILLHFIGKFHQLC